MDMGEIMKKAVVLEKTMEDKIENMDTGIIHFEKQQKEKERKFIPFSEADAQKAAKKGEKFAGRGMVKTEGFEKTIAFLMGMAGSIFTYMNKNKSFRMELFYDAESLNTNYCFYTPVSQCKKEDSQEFPTKPEGKAQ